MSHPEIRVHPSQVKISDYTPDKEYFQTVIVQNVSKQAVNIGIIEPVNTKTSGFTLLSSTAAVYSNEILLDPNFINQSQTKKSTFSAISSAKFKNAHLGKKVAAGLETAFKIKFQINSSSPQSKKLISDSIGIFVDGTKHDFKLTAIPPKEKLSTIGDLDFGSVIADQTVRTKFVTIKNSGRANGSFSTKLISNTSELSMQEINKEEIKAGMEKQVKVHFTPTNAGGEGQEIVAQLMVQTVSTGHQEIIPIKASIVMPRLTVHVLESHRNDMIEFGTIYSNTTMTKSIKVTNNSPEKTTYNASILIDQEGELMGQTCDTTSMEALYQTDGQTSTGGQTSSKYDAFQISPSTGFLNPGQSSIIDITFKPLISKSHFKSNSFISKKDFVVFMTIHAGNWSEEIGDSIKAIAKPCEVALVGSVTNPNVEFSPSDYVDFSTLKVGDKTNKKITVRNNASIPIDISLSKIPHFNITPSNFKVSSFSEQELTVAFHPKHDGEFNLKTLVSLLAQNQVLSKDCLFLSGVSVRKDGMVGTKKINQNNKLTFKDSRDVKPSKNPRKLALLESTLHDKKNQNDFIALPDDLSTSIRPYKNSEKYKTPFTRKPRYQYIDPDYAFTPEEATERAMHSRDGHVQDSLCTCT